MNEDGSGKPLKLTILPENKSRTCEVHASVCQKLFIGQHRTKRRGMLDQRNVQSPLPTLDGFGVQESNENALSGEVDAIPGENGVQWCGLGTGQN